jgi:D-lactate dehydrogenase (cytochrome)
VEILIAVTFSRKSSAGFDTTKLFVGAEGTLGIVTEGMISCRSSVDYEAHILFLGRIATVRLAPVLPTTVAVCGFPSVERAVSASGEIINKGVPIRESPHGSRLSHANSGRFVQNASNCATAP